jgi:hypothetical protein
MIALTLHALELDEFGRARLSDDDLKSLDDLIDFASAGGTPTTNDSCGGSTNATCNNLRCDGSTNGPCSNTSACNSTTNKIRCHNSGGGPVPIEVEPEG